jgi:hypothetical protein
MDYLTFTVEIIKALAWPLATLGIAGMFRDQFRTLLSRVRKGKLGPAEFEFEESVRALKDEAADLPKREPVRLPPETIRLLDSNPRSAIISAWLELEEAMRDLLRSKGFAPQALASPLRTIQLIKDLGIVDPVYVVFTDELRHLRNRATHELDFKPAHESVIDYVRLATELTDVYRSATKL